MKKPSAFPGAQPLPRWAAVGLIAAGALWLGAYALPRHADWVNGGVLFADYLCLCACLLVAGGALWRGSLEGLGWPELVAAPLVAWLFCRGAQASADSLANFGAIPYFSLGTLLWAFLCAKARPAARKEAPVAWRWAAGLLLGGLALGAALWALRAWAQAHLQWPQDRNSLDMLLIARAGGSANDISGGPFTQGAWLWVVALWLALFSALVFWRDRLGDRGLMAGLFALAMFGKIALAGLSTQGLHVIPLKIESENTSYFKYADKIHDPFIFIMGFDTAQASAGPHVSAHPPLAVLFYWLLRNCLFANSTLVALAVMAFSAAAIWPLYRLGRGLGGRDGGLACAGLFATSPLSLVLGNAGIDSVVLTFIALSVWCLWEASGSKARAWAWAAASGGALSLAALNSFGAVASLAFLGSWGLMLLWRQEPKWPAFLRRNGVIWGSFSAGILGVQGALWALSWGHFNYLESMQTAKFVHLGVNAYRNYELWSWANVVLYSGYAGLGLVALWVAAVAGSLFKADISDPMVAASGAAVIALVLEAFGRAEVQRIYLFGSAFLLPAAAAALPRDRNGRVQVSALAVALALNALGAVLLQCNVLDYW